MKTNIEIKNIKIIPILQFLLSFIVILNCRSMYATLKGREIITKLLIVAFVGIIFCLFAFKQKMGSKEANKILIAISFFTIYFGVYFVLQNNTRKNFLIYGGSFILLLIYYILFEKDNSFPVILKNYKNIVFVLSVISLFFWVFGAVLNIIPIFSKEFTSWSSDGSLKPIDNYYYLSFVTQTLDDDSLINIGFPRNTSIFTEGPMASFHFCMAFLLESLYEKKPSKIKQFILIVSIITTFSTTGYILLIMFFVIKAFFIKSKTKSAAIIKFFSFSLMFLIATAGIIILFATKLSSGSGSLRINDYITCLKVWIHYPIFGAGIGDTEIIAEYMDFWRLSAGTGLANSPGQILAQGGLWIFILYFYAMLKALLISIKKRDKNSFIFIFLFSFMFAVTVVSYTYIILFLMIWFASNAQLKNNSIKEKISLLLGQK